MSDQVRDAAIAAVHDLEARGGQDPPVEDYVDTVLGIVAARLAAVEALALRWRAEAAERGAEDTILTAGAADMVLAAVVADPADTTR